MTDGKMENREAFYYIYAVNRIPQERAGGGFLSLSSNQKEKRAQKASSWLPFDDNKQEEEEQELSLRTPTKTKRLCSRISAHGERALRQTLSLSCA
jgi:hypothetical protein